MKKRILVLEKDKQLGNLASTILAVRGHEVVYDSSCQKAMEFVTNTPPDLIIVGEQMSDIDGLGLIAKVRDENDEIPIVFVARQWRDEDFYRMLREDLKVSLVAHRPLRTSVFSAQLFGLLGSNYDSPFSGETPLLDASSAPVPLPQTGSGDMTGMPSSVEFDKLKIRFVRSIPDRLGKLGTILNTLESGIQNTFLDNAITIAHNLKGTSLSWGFEEMGRLAENMERMLKLCIGTSGEVQRDQFQLCLPLYTHMQEQAELIHAQYSALTDTASNGDADGADENDGAVAKVLVVTDQPLPDARGQTDTGLSLDFIQTRSEDALIKASQMNLDAAIIEVSASTRDASLVLARELRDISGYENLPLGFISDAGQTDDRAASTHAGSSLFLERPLEPNMVRRVTSQLIAMREGGRFRVLVVDDDEDLAALTCRCLAQFGILARFVLDPLQVMTVLSEFNPDLILLDVVMPGMSGFEVCRALRSSPRWRDVPILFLTGQTDLNSRLTAYEAGADDYLPKPVINVELLTRVKVRLERSRELKERSERDMLTGLLLRRAFSEQVNSVIAECQRYDFKFSLCLMDVDHFKKVNDTYGHTAGDDVLATFGRLLRKRFRVEDVRGRWGGEEFILAFKHEKKEVMQVALTRIMEELKQIEFHGENDEIFHVTFSAGLASFPDEAENLQDLVKVADRRLYLAKERGRKQVIIED